MVLKLYIEWIKRQKCTYVTGASRVSVEAYSIRRLWPSERLERLPYALAATVDHVGLLFNKIFEWKILFPAVYGGWKVKVLNVSPQEANSRCDESWLRQLLEMSGTFNILDNNERVYKTNRDNLNYAAKERTHRSRVWDWFQHLIYKPQQSSLDFLREQFCACSLWWKLGEGSYISSD